jgi:hypothetical protein
VTNGRDLPVKIERIGWVINALLGHHRRVAPLRTSQGWDYRSNQRQLDGIFCATLYFTVCVSGSESPSQLELLANSESPPYTALIELGPASSVEVVK